MNETDAARIVAAEAHDRATQLDHAGRAINWRFTITHWRNDGSTYEYNTMEPDMARVYFEMGCNTAKLDHLVYGDGAERNVVQVDFADNLNPETGGATWSIL